MKIFALLSLVLSIAFACLGVIGIVLHNDGLRLVASIVFPFCFVSFIVACILLPSVKPRP